MVRILLEFLQIRSIYNCSITNHYVTKCAQDSYTYSHIVYMASARTGVPYNKQTSNMISELI